MGNLISCIDSKNKLYLYNTETSSWQPFNDLPTNYTVMEWGNKTDNIINIGLNNSTIRSININSKSWNDIQILKYGIFFFVQFIIIKKIKWLIVNIYMN